MFTIGLQAELGERRCAQLPEVKAHFDAILSQVEALRRYLDTLLLFSRPARLAPASVDPVAFVEEQIRSVEAGTGSGAGIRVQVETDGPSRRGNWDAGALGHALRAVLDNAIRSAVPAPETVVAIRCDDSGVTIEVRDSGPGIPADVLPRLAVPMAVRRAGRTGLGLAIARKMTEAHGGRLEIESRGQGTTARLVLPWGCPAPAA